MLNLDASFDGHFVDLAGGAPGIVATPFFNFPGDLSNGVTINSVTMDLNHTWSGDVQIFMQGPGGIQFTLVDRPGSVAGSVGNAR